MAANHTENWGLNQWEAEDPVIRADFNADNQAIETALNSFALNNCRICMGSYVGTGTIGEDQVVLSFPFKPLIIFMHIDYLKDVNDAPVYYILFHGKPVNYSSGTNTVHLATKWLDDNTVTFSYSDVKAPGTLFNTEGTTYRYIALGE